MFMMYFIVVETTYNGPRAGGKEIQLEEKGSSYTVVTESKETYKQQLRLFRGRISEESFWRGAWKPVPLIAYPAVLFSTVVYGSYFTWLLTISVLSVTAFSSPPYNLNPAQIGADWEVPPPTNCLPLNTILTPVNWSATAATSGVSLRPAS